MDQVRGLAELAEVAASTTRAAHGRDHDHTPGGLCHPHIVEVVYLGRRAMTVCHDCRADSGFLPCGDAKRLAVQHRDQTLEASVLLAHLEAS